MIWDRKKTYLMLCLSRLFPLHLPCFSSLHLCLSWLGRRSVGAERSHLVKRLADDKKIRGISLLTGCCVCVCFFFPHFFLLQMFFVSLFSVKLSRQHNKCNLCMHTHTHTLSKAHTHTKTRAGFLCSWRRQIWFCVLRLVAMGGGRRAVCSQRRLPLR